jgi:mannitol-specific phosphotransferase system IIBC component
MKKKGEIIMHKKYKKYKKDVIVNDSIGIIDLDKKKVVIIGKNTEKLSPELEEKRYQIIKASFENFFDSDKKE